jgi:hypothetical protein
VYGSAEKKNYSLSHALSHSFSTLRTLNFSNTLYRHHIAYTYMSVVRVLSYTCCQCLFDKNAFVICIYLLFLLHTFAYNNKRREENAFTLTMIQRKKACVYHIDQLSSKSKSITHYRGSKVLHCSSIINLHTSNSMTFQIKSECI